MLHSRLRIDGWAINVKRTYRVWRYEGRVFCILATEKPIPARAGAWFKRQQD